MSSIKVTFHYRYSDHQGTLGFIPDIIGAQWNFAVQGLVDQSTGFDNTFPSYSNYDGHPEAIASVTPTLVIVGDIFLWDVAVNQPPE